MRGGCARFLFSVSLPLCVFVIGCGDDGGPTDLGARDLGEADLSTLDLGGPDAGRRDLGDCVDADGDGYASHACGGEDCDDADSARYPGAYEVCDSAGHDEDCDETTFGDVDFDGDGAISAACCGFLGGAHECGADCDDTRPDVGFRAAQEICDGIDNDCDGLVDETSAAIPWYRDLDGDGFGDASAPTTLSCAAPSGYAVVPFDCDDRSSAVSPTAPEVCNGRDDDCDALVDEGGVCGGALDGGVADGGSVDGGSVDAGADPCARCVWSCVAERCDDPIRLGTHGFGGCAVRERGDVACWGSNSDGQVGFGSGISWARPVPIALTDVVQVAGGYLHTCALTAAGVLYCWGDNSRGQLGVGDLVDRLTPEPVSIEADVIEVTAGGYHTCARRRTGELDCWGANDSGQLGLDSLDTERVWPSIVLAPTGTTALSGVVFVRAGGEHTCASTGAELYCWGANGSGQLGVGDTTPRARPALTALPRTPVSLATGTEHTCAIDRLGHLYCWGRGTSGALGSALAANASRPQLVTTTRFAAPVEVAAGAYHTCVRLRDGHVWCVGANDQSQLGDGARCSIALGESCTIDWVPTLIANVVSLSAMSEGMCAFLATGQLECWGRNSYGALGVGDDAVYTQPQLVLPP